MNAKHLKAFRVTSLIFVLCLIPLLYLAKLYQDNVSLDVTGFGVVPEFAMMFKNNSKGMTHMDTEKHSTVLVVAKDHCAQGCTELVNQMKQIKSYYDQNLKGNVKDPNTPEPVRFIVQATAGWDKFPKDWDMAIMSEGVPYLVPSVKESGPFPAVVLVDDSSFYRGFVPSTDTELVVKVQTELERMKSTQFLMHYVAKQTLMWKKARGRSKE